MDCRSLPRGLNSLGYAAGEGAIRIPVMELPTSLACSDESRWRLWDDRVVEPAALGVVRDTNMALDVARDGLAPMARLWTTQRAIVATQREGRRPRFAEAACRLAAEGWPVTVRTTGGSAFPVGPGILNLSLAFPRADSRNIDDVYRILCAPIQSALSAFGLRVVHGRARNAICEGESDLLIDGCKIAGTAQSWRGSAAGGAVLAHAAILVAGDVRSASQAIERFHKWSGYAAEIDPSAVTTLEDELRWRIIERSDALVEHVRHSIRLALCASNFRRNRAYDRNAVGGK